jgi:hypothetical protein
MYPGDESTTQILMFLRWYLAIRPGAGRFFSRTNAEINGLSLLRARWTWRRG